MKSHFDKELFVRIKEEQICMPKEIQQAVQEQLDALPEKKIKNKSSLFYKPYFLKYALATVAIVFFILPNINNDIAYAMGSIPVIGKIVQVVTIQNYFYKDENNILEVNIPGVKQEGEEHLNSAINYINANVAELTNAVLDEFYAEIEQYQGGAHHAVDINYDVITNSDNWFTLRLAIFKAAASGNMQYVFYNLDKETGEMVKLSDLFVSDDYLDAIADNIKEQMLDEMKNNSDKIYWLNEEDYQTNFNEIHSEQNYFFTENNQLVIVFDEYEVGPGSMGCPEFVIPKKVYEPYLKERYK